jgi:hypothetical protein
MNIGHSQGDIPGNEMRPAVALGAVAVLAACDMDVSVGHINAGGAPSTTTRNINKAFAAREVCLAKHAEEAATSGIEVAALAQTIAARCKSETDALIVASLGYTDSRVAIAIRDETESRAMTFAKRAQRK